MKTHLEQIPGREAMVAMSLLCQSRIRAVSIPWTGGQIDSLAASNCVNVA